jgi:hypothetical protein
MKLNEAASFNTRDMMVSSILLSPSLLSCMEDPQLVWLGCSFGTPGGVCYPAELPLP